LNEPEVRTPASRTARIVWLNLAGVAAVILVLYTVYAFRSVLTAFFLAALLAYLLDPVVDQLERVGLSRWVGILLLMVFLLLFAAAVSVLVFPLIQSHITDLIHRFPQYVEQLRSWIAPWVMRMTGMDASELGLTVNSLAARLKSLPPNLWQSASGLLWQATSGLLNVTLLLVNLTVIPVAAFYLLRDFDVLKKRALGYVPPKHRVFLIQRFERTDELLGSFIKGQFLVALCLVVVYSAGLMIVGTPLPIGIGIVAGLANIVPYLGLIVGLLPALVMTVLEFRDVAHLLGVVAVFAVGQGLEGFVFTPRIVGRRIGLHPVVVMLAVLIGGSAFGFLGVLLGVPAAVVLKVWWEALTSQYRQSDFYGSP
jgi:predicted PurR-regulated permease PerM